MPCLRLICGPPSRNSPQPSLTPIAFLEDRFVTPTCVIVRPFNALVVTEYTSTKGCGLKVGKHTRLQSPGGATAALLSPRVSALNEVNAKQVANTAAISMAEN